MPTLLESGNRTAINDAQEVPVMTEAEHYAQEQLQSGNPNEVQFISEQPEATVDTFEGENQAGPNEAQLRQKPVEVREFQDKHGNTRYMKQGVNAETGHKFTSFISKEEAEVLRMTAASREKQPVFDISNAPDYVQRAMEKVDAAKDSSEEVHDGLLEDLPEGIKAVVLKQEDKTPLTADGEITSDDLATTSEAQDVVLTPDESNLREFHVKTGHRGAHFKKEHEPQHLAEEHQPRHLKKEAAPSRMAKARKFLGKVVNKSAIMLGLVDDRTFSKLPPNYYDKLETETANRQPQPSMRPEELPAELPSGEVEIRAERAGEDEDKAA